MNFVAVVGFRRTGGAGIGKNLAVGGSLRVYGDIEVTGATTQSGNTGFSGRVSITNTNDVTSFGDNNVAFTVDGGVRVTKNQYIGGDFIVYDNSNARNAFFVDVSTGDAELHNTLTVGGNLIVNGTTTTVNSTVTTLDDPIITLGGDTAPASNDAKDRGVEFRYFDSTAKVGFFGYDRSANQFTFLTDATNTSEVLAGTDGALRAGSLNLTGTGTILDVDADANIDGQLTVDGQIRSQVVSGPALVIPNTTKINNLNADLLDGYTTASANTASTVVVRDGQGDFAANIITVASGTGAGAGIQGNATTADALKTARDLTIEGVVTGTVSFDGSANVSIATSFSDTDISALAAQVGTGIVTRTATGVYAQRSLAVTAASGITITNADGVSGNPTLNVASASTNAANNLVLRDASGNFAANVITAALTGNVTGQVSDVSNHDTDDIVEGVTNLYYTDARADARIAAADTDDLSEGLTNLYYTDARADARIAAATTDDLSEGLTNVYYTEARFDTSLAGKTTDDVTEGSSNLYYTDARAAASFDTKIAAALVTDLSDVDQALASTDSPTFVTVTANLRGNVDGNVSGEVTLDGAEPTIATDPGVAGDIRYDANYVYVCVSTNNWKRSALATW